MTDPHHSALPAARVGDPAHLVALQSSLRGLGYEGFDAPTSGNPAFAQVVSAMRERRAGNCTTATEQWDAASVALARTDSDAARAWLARAWIGRACCALGDGHAAEAFELAARAYAYGNHDEARLITSLAEYDKGQREASHELMLELRKHGDAHIQAAIDAWLAATGLVL